ncbi:putative membrane protein [Limihaloglobus sulfuriphilus]|uniref:Putative membrane protein n=2 Tax=Limihaloglobus sulfuriphilus TaxID=1851148 RepID=A0A1Q2MHJ6_9BACT|nr:Bax inhibitor-1/YccA family protein [Limihaloglobus sulfuriphilus]AQQ72160.1 putative membrane protein [Limihaloglobus sulfuriphilus]
MFRNNRSMGGMFRSSNPAMNESVFDRVGRSSSASTDVMTINGSITKTAILLAIAFITAAFAWDRFYPADSAQSGFGLLIICLIASIVAAMVTIFKPTAAPIIAPIYAAFEGVLLGIISAMYASSASSVDPQTGQQSAFGPGIVINAIMLTFGVLACMLIAYRSGLIRATEKFKIGVVAATGAIALVYLASIVMGFFGASIPMIHSSGPIGIGFSLIVVIIASLNLILDFDFIERGADYGAPKYMEWYGAFGLMVTLVWLYLEILRLLSKLNRR